MKLFFYRRMVCGDMSFIVFVGHAVNEIDEIWQIDSIIEGACCASGTRLVSQNTEECKKNCNAFLVHYVTEREKI